MTATAEKRMAGIHTVAAVSCVTWLAVTAATHHASRRLWAGYGRLSLPEKLNWCNRITSALHVSTAWHSFLCLRKTYGNNQNPTNNL